MSERGSRRLRLEMARSHGATYADIRINRYRNQSVSFGAQASRGEGGPIEVPSVTDSESFGFGIRVLAEGTWGFASSYEVSNDAIARATARAVEIAGPTRPDGASLFDSHPLLRTKTRIVRPSPSIRSRCRSPRSWIFSCAVATLALAVNGVFSVRAFIASGARTDFSRRAREPDPPGNLPGRSGVHGPSGRCRPQAQVAHVPAHCGLCGVRGRAREPNWSKLAAASAPRRSNT